MSRVDQNYIRRDRDSSFDGRLDMSKYRISGLADPTDADDTVTRRYVASRFLPVHSFNALIIPILRGCLQSLFNIPVPWYLFDTVLKVTSWPAFISRCIIDAYFSFYGLVLGIDMNCGCRLYRSFWQMDLTYAMDCLLNSITGMNVAFLLTVSPPYTQLWLSQTD